MDLGIPSHKIKNLLESNPLKSRVLVRGLALHSSMSMGSTAVRGGLRVFSRTKTPQSFRFSWDHNDLRTARSEIRTRRSRLRGLSGENGRRDSIHHLLLEVIFEAVCTRIETKASIHHPLWVVVVVYRVGLPKKLFYGLGLPRPLSC